MLTPDDEVVGQALASIPGVIACAIGGSRATGVADQWSDTDLYAFWDGELAAPQQRASRLAPVADQNQVTSESIFGPEDHLYRRGRLVEVVYLGVQQVQQMLDQAYGPGLGGTAYSTAFLHTVARCQPIVDSTDVLATWQSQLASYPEPTRARIVAETAEALPTFISQIRTAQRRADLLMILDRRAAAQAALVNLLFALNRRYHPGEKRLLGHLAGLTHQVSEQERRLTLQASVDPLNPELPDLIADLYADSLDHI